MHFSLAIWEGIADVNSTPIKIVSGPTALSSLMLSSPTTQYCYRAMSVRQLRYAGRARAMLLINTYCGNAVPERCP